VDDAKEIMPWVESYLVEHLRWWSEAVTGSPWSTEHAERHMEEHDLTGAHWRDLLRANESKDCFVKVACDADLPLGVVSVEIREDRYLRAPMGVISWLYVAPAYRRRGLALRLLEAADGWMTWRDVAGRELFVTAANEAAVEAYRKRGYEVVDHRMLGAPPTADD